MTKIAQPKVMVSLRSRLVILCLLILFVFVVNIAIMIWASNNIEEVTNSIVSNDVDRILTNAQISRDLSEILAETHLLISTFYGNNQILENSSESLATAINNILDIEMGKPLTRSVEDFRIGLDQLLQQCFILNKKHVSIVTIDQTLNDLLSDLEETVSLKIVELVLGGEDFRALEQIGALIPSYRESMLQATLHFNKLSPTLTTIDDIEVIQEILDNLHLRFRTLLASDADVAAYGEKILSKIEFYRQSVDELQLEREELVHRLSILEDFKHKSLAEMEVLEGKSANAAHNMNNDIALITDSSVKFVLILSGSFAILLGIFTYIFLIWHIRRPMEVIHKGIVSISGGDLETRIELGRDDEWNVIESALNQMTGDLADSYSKLKQGNKELQRMYNKVEHNVRALEAEIHLREEAEKALQVSKEQYRRFFQDDLSAAFIADKNGDILLYNKAFIHMFGYPDEEGSKQLTLRDIFADSATYDQFLHQLKLLKRLEYYESEYIRYDGTMLYAVGNITATFNDQKDILELKGYLIDETKKKSAEMKSHQLEKQLQHSKKMEAIGTLAGGVAHDLNNILSGVVSYPDMLLVDMPDDSPYRKPISIIKESGQKAAAIVQDLLTLARRGVAVRDVINLNNVVLEYLESPDFKKVKSYHPDVDFEIQLAPELKLIEGSPIHLMKTVMNLVTNAAESITKQGKIAIRTENITVNDSRQNQNEIGPGQYTVLIISDTGEGISGTQLERIFEPFYTNKEMGRSGTGLGLAVVWGTVQDHNGFIDVNTKEEKGTTFTLYFPITLRKLPEQSRSLTLDCYKGTGQTILIIDDEKNQRVIATEMLGKLGYTVTSVGSGEEAVDYLKKNSVDLLILDMIMPPGIDGLETYKRIKKFKTNQKTVITSGYSETDRVREAQREGAVSYLKKPYTLEELGTAVQNELVN